MLPPITDLPKLLEICIDRLSDAIVITEAETIDKPGPKIIWANKVFYERNGYTPEEIIGQSPRILQGPKTDRATLDKVRAALEAWQSIRVEILNYCKDGSVYWNEFELVPIANEKGWYTHWVSVQRDITERKKIEHQLHQLAFYDTLTNLPNRRLLSDRLNQSICASKRSGLYGAVMFLDLDNFKSINDNYGHKAGDLLLVEVASRLTNCVREVDTVARFGGDEFVILLCGLRQDKKDSKILASTIAEKIRAALAKSYSLTLQSEVTVEYCCTVSIGVNLFVNHEVSEDDILKCADIAMYQAKEAGRNLICFYDDLRSQNLTHERVSIMNASEESRPPFPPFTAETAAQKVRAAENAWNLQVPEKIALAYSADSVWRNRAEFLQGRDEITAFLHRKWAREWDYRLIKELWAFHGNRIAVRFAYEWRDANRQWFRSFGNENWEFNAQGLMQKRHASINDLAISENERLFHWEFKTPRPDDYASLSDLNL